MRILAKCANCDAGLPIQAADADAVITCGGCGREIPLDMSDSVRSNQSVDRCPVCSGSDFYVRKDFDPKVGVAAVVAAVLISAVFYWYKLDVVAYAVLAVAALLDFVVYRFLDLVTVCYRCHTEFRGAYARTAAGFDLHTADVLEQEYERRIGRR